MNATAKLKRSLRKSLTLKGVSKEIIDSAVSDAFGGGGPKLQSIPRTVTKNMLVLFNRLGKTTVAVSWGKTGRFRVFSQDGYRSLVAHGRKVGSLPKTKKAATV